MALRHFSISSFSLNRFQPLNIYHLAYFYNFRFEYHDSWSYFQFPFDSFSFLHRIEKKIKRKNSVRIFYGSPMTRMARMNANNAIRRARVNTCFEKPWQWPTALRIGESWSGRKMESGAHQGNAAGIILEPSTFPMPRERERVVVRLLGKVEETW